MTWLETLAEQRRISGFIHLTLSFYHPLVILCPNTLKDKYEITGQTAAARMLDMDYFFKEGAHLAHI